MTLALRVLGSTIRQVSTHLTNAFLANVFAVLLSLPLLVLLSAIAHAVSLSALPLGVVLLIGVLPNPALGGLQVAGSAIAVSETASIREQWVGVARYWRPSLRAWLAGLVVSVVILLNISFYPRLGASQSALHLLAGPLELVWLSAAAFWLTMHLYVYPLLLRQDRPSVVLAYRNAAVATLKRPLFSAILTLAWLLWLVLTATTGPAYLIGLIVAATIQQNALLRIIPGNEPSDKAAS